MEFLESFLDENGICSFDFPPEMTEEYAEEEIVYHWKGGDVIENE